MEAITSRRGGRFQLSRGGQCILGGRIADKHHYCAQKKREGASMNLKDRDLTLIKLLRIRNITDT